VGLGALLAIFIAAAAATWVAGSLPKSPMSIAIVLFFLIGVVGINRARQRPGWTLGGEAPLLALPAYGVGVALTKVPG
jgi:hypothetical protein